MENRTNALFRKFVIGTLNEQEKQEFNNILQKDKKLQEKVRFLLAFTGAMEDLAWDKERDEWKKYAKRMRIIRILFIFIIVITITALYFWFK